MKVGAARNTHRHGVPVLFSRISDADFQQLKAIVDTVPEVKFICLDVANGYSQFFVDFVKKVRDTLPSHTIMVRVDPKQAWAKLRLSFSIKNDRIDLSKHKRL